MTFSGWWRLLDRALKAIMAILMFAMMAIMTVDVVGRYVFNAPVPGGFEIVQYLMAIVVFAALPLTTAADKHLSVSMISGQLRGATKYVHRIFVLAVSAVAVVMIAWRMGEQAAILARSQQVSGFLQWPLAPIAWTMTALASLAALIVLVKLATALIGREVESLTIATPGAD